ncbi:MAG TPA: bifunctional UDP-N-acetylglucosamine diphosphorylase/glucosamine-1-phosphate N-acetyltransferase GlmU [Thermodesulfobacteriota bacterium]
MSSPVTAIVLAAGQGTRMRSSRAKVLHEAAGWPLLRHVLAAVRALEPARITVVVGHQADQVRAAVADLPVEFVLQAEQRGTGHAVLQARAQVLAASGPVLILYGDVPCVRPTTLSRLEDTFRRSGRPLAMATARVADPAGYGRVVRDARGEVLRVVEHKDASEAERALDEINTGLYMVDARFLAAWLARVEQGGSRASSALTGEVYLTDLVALAAQQGGVAALEVADAEEVLGVNTREELARAAARLRADIARRHMAAGVTIVDPERTYIDAGVEIGPDTIVHPGAHLRGRTRIGAGATIDVGAVLTDMVVGDGTEILPYCVLEQSEVGAGARLGPHTRIRPGCHLADGVHVGNFVELKKTTIGPGSKANHLTYLGDATIGAGVNIGAGTITCNYDGARKHQTVIEDGAFIGSDSQLVAPVTVGKDAYVASGSSITEDVPPGALAIARSRQVNKPGWVAARGPKRGSAGHPTEKAGAVSGATRETAARTPADKRGSR